MTPAELAHALGRADIVASDLTCAAGRVQAVASRTTGADRLTLDAALKDMDHARDTLRAVRDALSAQQEVERLSNPAKALLSRCKYESAECPGRGGRYDAMCPDCRESRVAELMANGLSRYEAHMKMDREARMTEGP